MKRIITITILCVGAVAMFAQTPALKVNGDGNVGINEGSPDKKLVVAQEFQNFNEVAAEFKNTSTFNGFAIAANSTNGGNANMGLFVNGAARGNIGYDASREFFGLLNQGYTSNDFQFRLNNDGSFSFHNPNAGAASVFSITNNGSIAAGNTSTAGLAAGSIRILGDAIKPAGGPWVAPSDKKLKSNINDFTDGLDEILKIRTVTFAYNGNGGVKDHGKERVGIIAQDIQKVAPYMVEKFIHEEVQYVVDEGNEGGSAEAVRYKEAGTTTEEYLSVDPNAFTYMLINAVQEQQEIIAEQNERLSRLEEMIASGGTTNEIETTLTYVDAALLAQNTPNPFNGATNIEYAIPSDASTAEMKIFSQSGSLLKTVVIDHVGQGSLKVNADNLPSGTYSYHLVVDGKQVSANKMILQN